MFDVNNDCHERRMDDVILKTNDEDLGSLLAYMSGYAGNHEFFNEVFWSAVENIEPTERKVKLDYNNILDQWAEKMYEEIDKSEKRKDDSELRTPQYYTAKAYSDGLAMSMAILRRFEEKAKKKVSNN